MIKLAVHEKKNDAVGTVAGTMIFALFFSTVYIVINLMSAISKISGSKEFIDIARMATRKNIEIMEQVDALKQFIMIYGIVALIIILILFAVMVRSYVERNGANIWLLHAIGYNRFQIWRYISAAYMTDCLAAMLVTAAAAGLAMGFVFDAAGISAISENTGVEVHQRISVLPVTAAIASVYVTGIYGIKTLTKTRDIL